MTSTEQEEHSVGESIGSKQEEENPVQAESPAAEKRPSGLAVRIAVTSPSLARESARATYLLENTPQTELEEVKKREQSPVVLAAIRAHERHAAMVQQRREMDQYFEKVENEAKEREQAAKEADQREQEELLMSQAKSNEERRETSRQRAQKIREQRLRSQSEREANLSRPLPKSRAHQPSRDQMEVLADEVTEQRRTFYDTFRPPVVSDKILESPSRESSPSPPPPQFSPLSARQRGQIYASTIQRPRLTTSTLPEPKVTTPESIRKLHAKRHEAAERLAATSMISPVSPVWREVYEQHTGEAAPQSVAHGSSPVRSPSVDTPQLTATLEQVRRRSITAPGPVPPLGQCREEVLNEQITASKAATLLSGMTGATGMTSMTTMTAMTAMTSGSRRGSLSFTETGNSMRQGPKTLEEALMVLAEKRERLEALEPQMEGIGAS